MKLALISENNVATANAIAHVLHGQGFKPVLLDRLPYKNADIKRLETEYEGTVEVMASGMFLPPHLAMANRAVNPVHLISPNVPIPLSDREFLDVEDIVAEMTFTVVKASRPMAIGSALATNAAFYNSSRQTVAVTAIARPNIVESLGDKNLDRDGSIPYGEALPGENPVEETEEATKETHTHEVEF